MVTDVSAVRQHTQKWMRGACKTEAELMAHCICTVRHESDQSCFCRLLFYFKNSMPVFRSSASVCRAETVTGMAIGKTEENISTIGGRIRALRLQNHLSQEKLGFAIGVGSKSVISEYESGKRSVSAAVLPELARELHTTVDFLMNGSLEEELDPDVQMAMEILKGLRTKKGKRAALEHLKVVAVLEG